MLVLTRKEGEKIRIGDNVVITVVRTGGDKVRLGIEAPADQVVLRAELKDKSSAAMDFGTIPFESGSTVSCSAEIARCS